MSKVYLHIAAAIRRHRVTSTAATALLLLLLVDACATTQPTSMDAVRVEGTVTVRGNEPFTELVLQTPERNYYVLKFGSQEERSQMQNAAPASFAVSGDVYRDVWGSRAFAHLRVRSWQPLP